MNFISYFRFRPLLENDVPLLHKWRNTPHVMKYFGKGPFSLEDIQAKYLPRIKGQVPTYAHIAELGATPIGQLQCYRVKDYPLFAKDIGESSGVAVDLMLGEPSYIGKGFGKQMLKQYIHEIAFKLFPEENVCWICHEANNEAAKATSLSIGFVYVRDVIEDEKPSILLKLENQKK